MYTQNEKIVPVYIEDEMRDSYINYAMSVIVGRALPDVRDGLKPVHRRILHTMNELALQHNKPYKKSARIVGDCLGKYHPHGDTAVYDTLVRMVQDFSLRYPLADGQGNWGSIDGDSSAAMRYTEARLSEIAEEMLADIDKDTVAFVPNFDGSLTEPSLLPSKFPNLLVNGSSGIAVGMATNIPPHNMSEILDGVVAVIDKPDVSIKELMRLVKGPDFPTGGIIAGVEGIRDAYLTGRGLLRIHARASIEEEKGGRESIIVTEIPYQVNKTTLIESIADLVRDKKIDGISDIRDESDKEGMRIVIELKRDANAQIVLNQLYKHTQMQTTFGVIMLALVDNHPRVLNLKELIEQYILHRKEMIIRRTRFELGRALDRAHILEGLKKAIQHLDAVIKTIRKSKSIPDAKAALSKQFDLTEVQAQAIVDMTLGRLTALERDKLEQEYLELIKKIELFRSILKSERKVLEIIKEELAEIKKKYGDERRTEIAARAEEIEIEDLIAKEDVVVTISHSGYIKRLPVSAYRRQRRGGKGITAAEMKEEDFIERLFIASTHDYILFFTNGGRVHWLKVHEVPQASRQAKGKAIINILQLQQGETIRALMAVSNFDTGRNLIMATRQGIIKKTKLEEYSHPRRAGIIGITLEKGDELIEAGLTDGRSEILLATREGKAIRFPEAQVREMGRSARGVKGISLGKKDEVIGLKVVQPDATLLSVTAGGFGKRTKFSEYRKQSRGGKGIINVKVTKKNGSVVGILTANDQDEVMVITQSGMVVRTPVKGIRVIGRSTQGVRIMSLKPKDPVVAVASVVAREEDEEEAEAPLVPAKA